MRWIISFLLTACLSVFLLSCGGDGEGGPDTQLSGGCNIYAIANGKQCGQTRGPIAYLALHAGGGYAGSCTGTFVAPNKIVTAAHCLDGVSGITVVSGDYVSSAVQAIKHPKWKNNVNNRFDIGIVVVADPINSELIPLLASVAPFVGMRVQVMGYGLDENRDPGVSKNPQEKLKGATMVITGVDNSYFYSSFDTSDSAICLGDSGGPAIGKNVAGLPGLIGVNHAVYAPIDGQGLPICDAEGVVSIFVPIPDNEIINFILKHIPEAGIL
ncbi:MAG: S1 family peptidase [Deltaproteobacteria bacterium]|nr:S1 family peptidase [Deltaproteobacteria bacterium]